MRARLRLQSKTTQIDEHFHIHRIGFALTPHCMLRYIVHINHMEISASSLRVCFDFHFCNINLIYYPALMS